jgi:Flp pilus assembly protein TadG
MRNTKLPFIYRLIRDESGQILLPWYCIVALSFLGMTGLVTDVGRAYLAKSQLQNAANAAALAAAGNVYNSSGTEDAYNFAKAYSGSSGDNNAYGLKNVSTSISEGCVNQLLPSGSTCASSTVKNAVQVTESSSVRAYIMPIFWGSNTITVTATATASMQGQATGGPQGWNVAIVVDASDSMVTNTDTNCSTGSATRFTCALESVQTLLGAIQPCTAGGSTCTPSNSLFRVALFAFPNVSVATRPDDYGCSGTTPTPEMYTFPLTSLSGYSPLSYTKSSTTEIPSSTYAVTLPSTGNADARGFLSDYYSTSASNHLNSSSEVVKAIGGASGCTQMNTAGGESTYYGGVLYAAQDALKAEQAAYPNASNALIILSDGEANAANTKFPSTGWNSSPSADGYSVVTNSTSSVGNLTNPTVSADFGKYPDFNDQCQQAIVAGQTASTAGTRVYAVAYGSESSGCTTSSSGTDSTLVATGNNQSFTLSQLTPCITMENIASSLEYFYSDYDESGSGSTCVDNSHTTVNLSDISLAIASSLTKPRLLPNNQFLYGVAQTS